MIEDEMPMRRPWEVMPFNFGYLRATEDDWFERNKLDVLLALVKGSDDLRMMRYTAVSMLSEVSDPSKFLDDESSRGADGLDQLMLLKWLRFWATFIGLLSATQVRTIEAMSGYGKREEVVTHFHKQIGRRHEVISTELAAAQTREWAEMKLVVGFFGGTFSPPTTAHLHCATYWSQWCDRLVIGVDSDEFELARKGRNRYPFVDKYSVWQDFGEVVSAVVEVPGDIYQDGKYDEDRVAEYYRNLGIGVVFFGQKEPGYLGRVRQIKKAGAIPFASDPFWLDGGRRVSSTMIMENVGRDYFMQVLGGRWER